jgi:hypothetical protein
MVAAPDIPPPLLLVRVVQTIANKTVQEGKVVNETATSPLSLL